MPAFCNLFGSFEATAAVLELAEEAAAVAEMAAGALIFAFGCFCIIGEPVGKPVKEPVSA